MRRLYNIERDETGLPVRMVWVGDFEPPPKPPCMFEFKTRGGTEYRCKLAAEHRGPHEFID